GAATNVVDSGLTNMGIVLTSAQSGNAIALGQAVTEGVTDNHMSFDLRATLMNTAPGTTLNTGDFHADLTLSAKFE
ncbi:hypothetical protein ACXWON_09850, partial [Streptococcus pyogenes]